MGTLYSSTFAGLFEFIVPSLYYLITLQGDKTVTNERSVGNGYKK